MSDLSIQEDVLLAGDWHGSAGQGLAALRRARDLGIGVVIQLGDFGIWDYGETDDYLGRLSLFLTENDMVLYFIDGNHENFDMLYDVPVSDDGLRYVRDRIIHLPRGTVFDWQEYRVLALGGAYSIDRDFRVLLKSYWEEETITEEDIETALANAGDGVDILLSHDSPLSVPNAVVDDEEDQRKAAHFFGTGHLHNSGLSRLALDQVYTRVTPRLVAHGHYHKYFTGRTDHGIVIGLDEGGGKLKENTFVLRKDEFEALVS